MCKHLHRLAFRHVHRHVCRHVLRRVPIGHNYIGHNYGGHNYFFSVDTYSDAYLSLAELAKGWPCAYRYVRRHVSRRVRARTHTRARVWTCKRTGLQRQHYFIGRGGGGRRQDPVAPPRQDGAAARRRSNTIFFTARALGSSSRSRAPLPLPRRWPFHRCQDQGA